MAPNKQKVVAPKQAGRKIGGQPNGSRNSQSATPTPGPAKITLKLKLKPSAGDALPPVSAYQFPLSAPPSDEPPGKEDAEGDSLPTLGGQSVRRGGRQRTKKQAPDMIFGSEVDNLISSAKTGNEEDVQMPSSPPTILSMAPAKRSPARQRYDEHANDVSSDTVQGSDAAFPRYDGPVDPYIYELLNSLCGSSVAHVDLPDLSNAANPGIAKPYTADFLTQLYIQCYENRLWHLCDLVADTWIRALQRANSRSRRSKDERDHRWRHNSALRKKFNKGLKGFKVDVDDYNLDIEDPELHSDVADFDPARLHQLYNHTAPKCGARLLWADAMALCGKKMENRIVRQPDVWPQDLFYDVMCTSLRMVGRKLTLKIEERYEGAWCRYHEHSKHGLPCYRALAWTQKGGGEQNDEEEEDDIGISMGEKRGYEAVDGDEQGRTKRVRFNAGGVIDIGDIDAEGESEED